jgi:hypothetical protein
MHEVRPASRIIPTPRPFPYPETNELFRLAQTHAAPLESPYIAKNHHSTKCFTPVNSGDALLVDNQTRLNKPNAAYGLAGAVREMAADS